MTIKPTLILDGRAVPYRVVFARAETVQASTTLSVKVERR